MNQLVEVAGLAEKLDEGARREMEFEVRWVVVKQWSEDSRYKLRGEKDAKALYDAIVDPKYGVLEWLGQHW